jgi:hypothetical protein
MCGDIRILETKLWRTQTGKSFTSTKWLLTSIFVVFYSWGFCQFEQVDQLEIPVQSDHDYFEIASTEAEGLILYRLLSSFRSNHLEIIHVDTAFNQKWSGSLEVDKGLNLTNQHADKNFLSLLFQPKDFSNRNFELINIDLENGTYTQFGIRNWIPFLPTHFETTENGVLIGGYFVKVPIVIFFNTSTHQSKILPGLFNEPGELTQIKVNEDGGFNVLISAKNFNKQHTIWIKNYDQNGNINSNVMLNPGETSLLFGRTIKTDSDDNIIAGVYGGKNTEYSRGIFVARINKAGDQEINYYNFGDLENFFSYMKAKREKRIKDRIARKKIKRKKVKFSYRFLVHELVSYNNQLIMLGEAFYPKYRTVDGVGNFIYGRSSGVVFVGSQYTRAVVLGIV